MRVLHVTGCYLPATEWGGAVTAVAGLADALSGAGVEVEVFTTTQRSSRALSPIAPGPATLGPVPVTRFRSVERAGRAFLAPSLVPALRRRIREFDLVHVHMLWGFPGIAAALACRAAGVPYVVTPHGALDPWALGQRALEKRIFLALAERRNLEEAALLHFTARAEQAAAPTWARALPGAIVPNAVDASPFLDLGSRERRARSREILVLGRVHAMKGFDVLIPAMRRVADADPLARLVVAGPDEGGYLDRVRRMVAEHGLSGMVEFTGHLDAAGRARALERAGLLAAPSYRENFGMAVAEAMAAGLSVVVSDRVNICGDIAGAGAGLVVPLEAAALAGALVRLLREPGERQRMGEAGRRLVVERYSAGTVGTAMRSAYQEVLARGRRRGAS